MNGGSAVKDRNGFVVYNTSHTGERKTLPIPPAGVFEGCTVQGHVYEWSDIEKHFVCTQCGHLYGSAQLEYRW